MKIRQIAYGAMQVAIVGGVVVWNFEANPEPVQPAAAIFVGVGLAVIATAIVYWTGEGIKRLLGRPRSPPLVPPKSAFDSLRLPKRQRRIDERGG